MRQINNRMSRTNLEWLKDSKKARIGTMKRNLKKCLILVTKEQNPQKTANKKASF